MSPFTGHKPGLTAPIFVAVLFSFLAGCGDPELPDPPPKKVKAVKLGGVSDLAERSFPGRARAAQEVNLSFRVSGPLVDLPVNVGDEVTQGQLLAQIDPTDYESRVKAVRGELQSGVCVWKHRYPLVRMKSGAVVQIGAYVYGFHSKLGKPVA